MAFKEDFSIFFDTDGFGVEFTYTPSIGASLTCKGIFDSAYSAARGGEVDIASQQPQIEYETAAIPEPTYGEFVTVAGKQYTIVGIEPDGTGTTTLKLEETDDDAC
jgi:hypothetical protein